MKQEVHNRPTKNWILVLCGYFFNEATIYGAIENINCMAELNPVPERSLEPFILFRSRASEWFRVKGVDSI